MAIASLETPSSLSQSSRQSRHFYLTVDRLQFKMEMLVDLLRVAGQRPGLPMVVCCSSRNELDAVCCAVSNLSFISLTSLYSDVAEAERALVLERFRQSTVRWKQVSAGLPGDDKEKVEEAQKKSHVIVLTDVCLPLIASGEPPLSAQLLINYELPAKKETYMRRMAACLASDGIVINMVVGGEVIMLKSLEKSSNLFIAEMPINEDDIEEEVDDTSIYIRRREEITSSSEVGFDESSTDKPTSEVNSHWRSTLEKAKMPPETELEEFFSTAEKYHLEFFKNKYNFDFEKEESLEGQYEWIQLKPEDKI